MRGGFTTQAKDTSTVSLRSPPALTPEPGRPIVDKKRENLTEKKMPELETELISLELGVNICEFKTCLPD